MKLYWTETARQDPGVLGVLQRTQPVDLLFDRTFEQFDLERDQARLAGYPGFQTFRGGVEHLTTKSICGCGIRLPIARCW